VDQESPTSLEPNDQILAATVHRYDPFAREFARHVVGIERSRQPRVEDPDLRQLAPLERRRKPQPNRLDLGQLWHDRTVAMGRAMTA
jgi:hypothetical protein